MRRVFFAAALAVLCLCLAVPALGAAAPDPLPPVEDPAAQMSDKAPEPASGEAASLEPSGEATSEEPSEELSPEPDEPAVPLMPGRYEGADGGVLSVKEDGACTYETMVSGTVNGRAMSGRLTFHGTVENGEFSFTNVTFFGLDLTKAAEDAGYTDASYWEEEAAALYAEAVGS